VCACVRARLHKCMHTVDIHDRKAALQKAFTFGKNLLIYHQAPEHYVGEIRKHVMGDKGADVMYSSAGI